ncbi:MAG: sulfatase-like hydrolase/transferase [Saprospiraceae bacterium]|nr:sulfatase-like hydrolase/transferase [Saprospiraceae bacterium]
MRNYLRFGQLDREQTTFGHIFRDAGYATCIVGKWQLGRDSMSPARAGFDEHFLWQVTQGRTDSTGRDTRFSNPVLEKNGELIKFENNEYGPDLVSDFGLEFIQKSVNSQKPFFLYYPMILTHCPFSATPDSPYYFTDDSTLMRYKGEPHYFTDMVAYMDKIIGKIQHKLQQLDVDDNTLLIFTGDNGTDKPIVSLLNGRKVAGAKGASVDGGTRVPLIVSWPGRVKNQVNSDLVDFTDFLPTICDAAGISIPDSLDIDGKSFWPQLQGQAGSPREWIYNWYSRSGKVNDARIFARNQDYKLYATGEFYNVPNDYLEERSLDYGSLSQEKTVIYDRLKSVIDHYAGRRAEDINFHDKQEN